VRTLRITLIKYIIRLEDIGDGLVGASDASVLLKLIVRVFKEGSRVLEDISFIEVCK
jgi:hypothetical protein